MMVDCACHLVCGFLSYCFWFTLFTFCLVALIVGFVLVFLSCLVWGLLLLLVGSFGVRLAAGDELLVMILGLLVSGLFSGWIVVLVCVVYFGLFRFDAVCGGCGFNSVGFS